MHKHAHTHNAIGIASVTKQTCPSHSLVTFASLRSLLCSFFIMTSIRSQVSRTPKHAVVGARATSLESHSPNACI